MTNYSLLEEPFSNKCSFLDVLFDHQDKTLALTIVTTILNCVTFPFSLVGNLAIIIAISKTPSLQNPSNFLISSLALADFLTSLFCQPLRVICNIFEFTNNFSWYCFCFVALAATAWASSAVSCFTLGMIAVERYLALHYHLRYHQLVSIKKVAIPVIITWAFCITVVASRYLTRGSFSFEQLFMVLLCINFFVIFIAYAKIYQIVKRHRCQIKTQQRSVNSIECYSMEGMTDFDRQISKRKQSKVTTGPLPIQESTSEIQNHQQAIRELALSNLTTKQSKKSISADRCSQERVLSSSDHNQTTSQQKELKSMEHCQSIINQRGIENQEEKCQTAGHNLPNVSRTQHSLVNHEIQINEPCFTKQQANRNRIQLARYRKSTLTMFLVLGLFILAYFPVICVQTIKSVIGYKNEFHVN